jgi:hypothetical protein
MPSRIQCVLSITSDELAKRVFATPTSIPVGTLVLTVLGSAELSDRLSSNAVKAGLRNPKAKGRCLGLVRKFAGTVSHL